MAPYCFQSLPRRAFTASRSFVPPFFDQWVGNLTGFSFDKAYKLNATAPYTETLVGEPTDPTTIDITLNGNGWTWIGYPCQATNSLDAAFSGATPQEGDMVKNQSSFSIYTEGEWIGTLNAMQPGDGYMYQRTVSTDKTFNFPKPAVSGKKNAPVTANMRPVAYATQTRDNMTMVAVVMNGDEVIEDAQVSVYAGTELRGFSAEAVREGRHFLTIGGLGGQPDVLTFVVNTEDGEYMLVQTETFAADACKGSMKKPVVLQLDGATGIDMTLSGIDIKRVQLIDNGGRVVSTSNKLYKKADLQRLPAGVYYQQVTYVNGQTRVQKLMR